MIDSIGSCPFGNETIARNSGARARDCGGRGGTRSSKFKLSNCQILLFCFFARISKLLVVASAIIITTTTMPFFGVLGPLLIMVVVPCACHLPHSAVSVDATVDL